MPTSPASPSGQKRFYARLPAASYRKLRRLAKLPPIPVIGERKALLVRVSPAVYLKLRRLALARSPRTGRIASMQSVVAELIDAAALERGRVQRSMAEVTVELITLARMKRNGAR